MLSLKKIDSTLIPHWFASPRFDDEKPQPVAVAE